jgi:hypothetical protein
MGIKLEKNTFPVSHGAEDFQCFGPPATKDGVFEGTMIADCGCFTQDGKDSNKYYHSAVVQSKCNQKWYVYFEWGRVGANHPSFQFTDCSNKSDAEHDYCDQLHQKNDKRGEWIQHPSLGKILRAKTGKDCYLVRPQAKRSTGLPDARTIVHNEGVSVVKTSKPTGKVSTVNVDKATLELMRDLNVGTVNYTRASMADAAIPTQVALDEARSILIAAQQRVSNVGDDVEDQIKDTELRHLTALMYGRIPKKKDRNASPDKWILSASNIGTWNLDIDAFESALKTADMGQDQADPFDGMRLQMRHLSKKGNPIGEFIHGWAPSATRNMHNYLKEKLQIINVWEIEREGDAAKIARVQAAIAAQNWKPSERPLHQPARSDLSRNIAKIYARTNTCLLFHGTRTVNVSGLLRESWRLRNNLVGVQLTAAMFGPGVYWADDWKKSAGYTSMSGAYWTKGGGGIGGRGAFMFIADVVLGASYLAPRAEGFTKPPNGYHSVFGKANFTKGSYGEIANNEFITYNSDQCVARYLVEFAR